MTSTRPAVGSPITPSELRVIRTYLVTGSTKAAAAALGVAESTIKNHLANARTRLNVSTTAQAVHVLHDRLAA
jgi:DNA-binding CsgD family transcriptional regulator